MVGVFVLLVFLVFMYVFVDVLIYVWLLEIMLYKVDSFVYFQVVCDDGVVFRFEDFFLQCWVVGDF